MRFIFHQAQVVFEGGVFKPRGQNFGKLRLPSPLWTLLLNSCYLVLWSSEQAPLPQVCPRGLYTPPSIYYIPPLLY